VGAVLSQRVSTRQASALRRRLSEACGAQVGGAAPTDGVPGAEPRVLRALALLYGREVPAPPAAWRPFRTWGCVLAVRHLAAAGLFGAQPGDRARRGQGAARKNLLTSAR
jgi:hypothetical protein